MQNELARVSQTQACRIRQLAERYAMLLPQPTAEVAELQVKVNGHLAKMGFRV